MTSYDIINSIDVSGAQGTITQRSSNTRDDGNPFFGGVGGGAIRVTLNNNIKNCVGPSYKATSKGWPHSISELNLSYY